MRGTAAWVRTRLYGAGGQVNAEIGYGLPVGTRFVGTPRNRLLSLAVRPGLSDGVLPGAAQHGEPRLELGRDAQRRENPQIGGVSNGVLGRVTISW